MDVYLILFNYEKDAIDMVIINMDKDFLKKGIHFNINLQVEVDNNKEGNSEVDNNMEGDAS